MSLGLGTTSGFLLDECRSLQGAYYEKQSQRYVAPRPCRALKVCIRSLNLIQRSTGNRIQLVSAADTE